MSFRSLFNRKSSRKNQSKDKAGQISKQNHLSEDGNIKEAHKSEGSTGKSELLHADSASQEGLKVEDKTCVRESDQLVTEASITRDILTEHTGEQTLSCDNGNKIKTDTENGASRLKENEITTDIENGVSRLKENEITTDTENGVSRLKENEITTDTENGVSRLKENEITTDTENGVSRLKENEITTDTENGVSRLKENEVHTDSDKNLSQANVNLTGDGTSEHSVDCVDETGSCSDANRQEQQNSALTYNTKDPISQIGGTDEENQLDTESCGTEQGESVSEKCTDHDESTKMKDTSITTHDDATKEIIVSLSQKMQYSEDSDTCLDGRLEKNEETAVNICDQENAPNTKSHTPTEEFSNEEVFSETNCSKEPQVSEQVVDALASESVKEFSSVTANNHETESASIVTNSSDNKNSVLPAKIASENEQQKDAENGNVEDKREEKISSTDVCPPEEISSMDICPPEEILSESKSIGNFADCEKEDHVMTDSQRISDKEQTVATDSEKMEVQSGPSCIGCEEMFEGTGNSDEKVVSNRNNKKCELEGNPDEKDMSNRNNEEYEFEENSDEKIMSNKNNNECESERNMDEEILSNRRNKECEFSTGSEKDFCNESSKDPEVRTQVRSFDTGETSGGDNSTEKSLNYESSEHDTENVQGNKIVSVSPLSATSISSVISNGGCTNEISETQIAMDVTQQNIRNSGEREEVKSNEVNNQNTNSRAEILENDFILEVDETNDISCPQDCADVATIQSTSPLEDSLDSFPSGCEDFLGGQRTLMAAEHHPPPTWKVGYLQVKLPVKSRGRGKLKVWRQRWVVIQMDEFVKDTKNPSLMINIYASECSNARSHSALFFCTVSASKTVVYRSQSRTHKYAFSISVDNDVVLHLAADSETASQEWMAAIRNLLWPPSPVLQLEKVLHGSDFEVSVIDNEFSFHAGLLGTYGNMKVTSNKLILSHPQTDHVIQEWYLNTLDKFQLLPQSKEEDGFKVVVMHTGQDSSTGSGQLILFCPDAVTMLQSIASTIHKLLQYRTTSGKDHKQKELAELAEWLSPAMSPSSAGEPPEDYYKIPRRQIRSLLDIPNFSFEKPISNEGLPQSQEIVVIKPSMLPSATSASTFSEDSGISMAIQPDDFLNCSVTSFTIGGRPVRDHTSSESSDGYSPPCSPEMQRKNQETEAT